MKTMLWTFVWTVTLFDVCFAWQNGWCFDAWELNPISVRLGLYGAIVLRLAGVSFASIIGRLVTSKWFASTIAAINAGVAAFYLPLVMK